MRILIDDGMQVNIGTGIGKYSLYLYQSLKNKLSGKNQVDLVDCEQIGSQRMKRLKYMLHINSSAYKNTCKGYDIVHYTNYALPFRRNRNVKYVVTIHDLASFLYPDSLPTIYRLYSRFVIRYAMKHADAILTVSNSVKKEIQEFFPRAAKKTFSIYPGHYAEITRYANSDYCFKDKLLAPLNRKPFFLFVGTIEKRKNIGMIIEGYFRLKDENPAAKDYALVLAGRPGYGYEEFEKNISRSKYRMDVILTGYIDKETCNKLYNKASAYIFPTVYEGFGSTQLECMTCHTPLILSDIKTNREVSGEYGIFFKLTDIDSLVKQMSTIASCDYDYEKRNLVADDTVKRFDWTVLADDYVKFYATVIQNEGS